MLVDAGEPKDFESLWLNAEYYLEQDDDARVDEWPKIYFRSDRKAHVPEWGITACLIEEALEKYFSAVPWQAKWDRPGHFFKLSQGKPCWKLW